MSNYQEAGKGIGMFILGNIIFYVAWKTFSALLDFSVTQDTKLGAMVWISFFGVYITTCVIYPMFAILIASDPEKETSFIEMLKAIFYWFIGTICSILIYVIVDSILGGLTAITFNVNTISGSSVTSSNASAHATTQLIGWLAVLTLYVIYLIILPFNQITMGFSGDTGK